jgi:endonuclease III
LPYKPRLRTKPEAIKILRLIGKSIRGKTALGKIGSETSDPFRVLISTILSARTRDPVTEMVSARLFSKYPDAAALSRAPLAKVVELIKPVAFYNNKAPNIIESARQIVEKFGGEVPRDYESLLDLPGVGRKTANCVLVYGFSEPAIPVDTHVHRIANRIGLVRTKTPEGTEKELSQLYAKKYWLDVNELFVSFGQATCRPIGPKCSVCPLSGMCNYFKQLKKTSD